jgi:hypothetical protein
VNPFKIDFQELYRRHLRRHSQFGINVLHLIAVAGTYIALYAIAFALPGSKWIVGTVLGLYFAVLAFNVPLRLWLTNVAVSLLLLSLFLTLPAMSVWVYVALIFFWHWFQIWNHKVYDKQQDMGEFTGKYRKGPLLFFLLSIYELPILLNYLVFDRKNWTS